MILNAFLKVILIAIGILSVLSFILIVCAIIYVYNGGEINIRYDREDREEE